MILDIGACYQFCKIDTADLPEAKKFIEKTAKELQLLGICILAEEGFNGTFSGARNNIIKLIEGILQWSSSRQLPEIKWSETTHHPFNRFSVKIRPEIVTTACSHLTLDNCSIPYESHLSPKEWQETLTNEKQDIFLVDTRNWYETQLGSFKGAVDPNIDEFTEFSDFMKDQNLPKDKKILMFCTGGIRCEKGILELVDQGYTNVYQLQGGILNYLKEYPNEEYDGECFVFDHRVSLDQDLKPSQKYDLCPHCGQPGDVRIICSRCDSKAIICKTCRDNTESSASETCSKNCAYHWAQRPGVKGPQQKRSFSVTSPES